MGIIVLFNLFLVFGCSLVGDLLVLEFGFYSRASNGIKPVVIAFAAITHSPSPRTLLLWKLFSTRILCSHTVYSGTFVVIIFNVKECFGILCLQVFASCLIVCLLACLMCVCFSVFLCCHVLRYRLLCMMNKLSFLS